MAIGRAIMETSPVKNFINQVSEIINELIEKAGDGDNELPYMSCLYYPQNGNIHVHIWFQWYISLDNEVCSENWLSRFFCKLAHGNDACGSDKYVALKRNAKQAYGKIVHNLNLPKFKSLLDQRPYCVFEMNRRTARLYFDADWLKMNDSLLSEKFADIKGKYLTEENSPELKELLVCQLAGELGLLEMPKIMGVKN